MYPYENMEMQVIWKIFQISGFAPYYMGEDRKHTKRSYCLTLYNMCLATALMYNLFMGETDERNNVDYSNKSFLVRITYDSVDVMENIQVTFVIIRSTIFTASSIETWFKIKSINKRLKELRVEFDDRKFIVYLIVKCICFVFLAAGFLAIDIYLCSLQNIYYTLNYWVLCGFPLIYASMTAVSFSGMTLILYQRFWLINECLRGFVTNNKEHVKEDFTQMGLSVDVPLENIITGAKPVKKIISSRLGNVTKVQPVDKLEQKKIPLFAMVKRGGHFGRNFYKERSKVSIIRSLKVLHFYLFDVSNDISSIFGWNLLLTLTNCFFGCTINFYFVIIYHLRSYDIGQYVSCGLWMLLYVFKVFYIVWHANKASCEAFRTTELLHMILNQTDLSDTNLQIELKAFCLQLSQCKVQLMAAGFFPVDKALLFQFFAGVLSNVVFIVQFDKINFNEP